MTRDHRDERRRQRRDAIHARRARRRASYGWEPPDPAALRAQDERDERDGVTPEERALREARAEANRKVGFLGHLVPYLAVVTFLKSSKEKV